MLEKIYKGLILGAITLSIMLAFELIFLIPGVEYSVLSLMQSKHGYLIYIGLWLIMFLQTTIIPIPALSIIALSNNMGIITKNIVLDLPFYAVTMSAFMVGALVSYWMGRKWGKNAIKWVAGSEEEYNQWADFINKKGRKVYFLTVLFPIFPDDLLCIVAGSIKFDLKNFIFSNLIGRLIGLISTVYILLSAMNFVGNNWMVYIYLFLTFICLGGIIVLRRIINDNRSK